MILPTEGVAKNVLLHGFHPPKKNDHTKSDHSMRTRTDTQHDTKTEYEYILDS